MRFRLGLAALILAVCASARGADQSARTVVVLSREIRPYLLAVEALEKALNRPVLRLYLEDGPARITDTLEDPSLPMDAVVAVGPEAANLVASSNPNAPMLALMVATPPSRFQLEAPLSAVVLSIPLEEQLDHLHRVLPDLNAVAVLLPPDPPWRDLSRTLALFQTLAPLRAIPLSPADPPALERTLDAAVEQRAQAVLFVPHSALASTAVIRHVVRQAVLRRLLPVGYNRSFLEAGAGAAFLFDPEDAGKLAAQVLASPRWGREPVVQVAPYRLVLKASTLKHLNLALPEPLPSGVVVE